MRFGGGETHTSTLPFSHISSSHSHSRTDALAHVLVPMLQSLLVLSRTRSLLSAAVLRLTRARAASSSTLSWKRDATFGRCALHRVRPLFFALSVSLSPSLSLVVLCPLSVACIGNMGASCSPPLTSTLSCLQCALCSVRAVLPKAGDVASFYDISLGRRREEHHDHAAVSGTSCVVLSCPRV